MTAATDVLVLVAVVVVFSATGLRAAGLAAALSAAVWFDFFLTEPYQSFAINDANDLEAAVLVPSGGSRLSRCCFAHCVGVTAGERRVEVDGLRCCHRPKKAAHVTYVGVGDRVLRPSTANQAVHSVTRVAGRRT